MKLSIIIINYRSEKIIEKCIKSIYYNNPFEIIIIDNENNPKLMKKLSSLPNIKNIKIIPYTKNLGFSKANNKAIEKARGKYIMALNADVFLTKDYIKECIKFLDNHQDYSSIQGKLISYKNKNIIDSTGNVLTKSGFAYSENHKVKNYNTKSKDIFGVCAAAAIYRKKALNDIKLEKDYFDSDFFAYLEDVDLDWRLRLKGWKAYFTNKAIAYHIREISTNHNYRFRQALKNRFFMVLKNSRPITFISNLIFYTPILLFLSCKIKNIRLIPKMIKKRNIIQKNPNHKNAERFMAKTPYLKWIKKITKALNSGIQ